MFIPPFPLAFPGATKVAQQKAKGVDTVKSKGGTGEKDPVYISNGKDENSSPNTLHDEDDHSDDPSLNMKLRSNDIEELRKDLFRKMCEEMQQLQQPGFGYIQQQQQQPGIGGIQQQQSGFGYIQQQQQQQEYLMHQPGVGDNSDQQPEVKKRRLHKPTATATDGIGGIQQQLYQPGIGGIQQHQPGIGGIQQQQQPGFGYIQQHHIVQELVYCVNQEKDDFERYERRMQFQQNHRKIENCLNQLLYSSR